MSAKLRYHAAPATLVLLAVILALTVLGLLTLSGAEAANKQPQCGETITADTTLDSDLVDCPNNGIVIGADDITLDLNGHRIDGDNELVEPPCPLGEFCDSGVVNDRHDGVKIEGGSTRAFGVGVLVLRSRESRVVDISSSKNVLFGAMIIRSSRSVIRDSSLSNNIAPEGDGIGLFGADHIRIVDNSIQDNAGPGIHIDGSAHNLIKGNQFGHDSPALLIDSDDNEVRHNRVVRGTGILVGRGDDNLIVGNRVSRADDALAVENGRGNLVARNVVIDARGYGIRLGIGNPLLGGGHNIVRRNLVKRSADDGFRVFAKDGHSLLRRNVAVGAGDDGFAIRSRTTKLAGNRAKRNADLGIATVRGVIDGGGNRASGSGDDRQCTHVRCR